MVMTARVRRFALTAHIACSVGWLGGVITSFALALAALIEPQEQMVRALLPTMDLIARWVLVPMSVASLLTGVIQSLGTRWGLVRHYWILVKLAMNLLATGVLLLYLQMLGHLARTAEAPFSSLQALRDPSPVAHSGTAILVLVAATVLSVYKPAGLTPHGRRVQDRLRSPMPAGVGSGQRSPDR
jgi:hypothetical protein